jgi:uncharacterized membrane-anchored protein
MQSNTEEFIEFDEPAENSPQAQRERTLQTAKRYFCEVMDAMDDRKRNTRQELRLCWDKLLFLANVPIRKDCEAYDLRASLAKKCLLRMRVQGEVDGLSMFGSRYY